MVLPSNAGFQIDATTRKGDISTDFSNIKVDKSVAAQNRALQVPLAMAPHTW